MRTSIVIGLAGLVFVMLALTGRDAAAQAPPHWTCPVSYAADGWCDCGCGNYDPDCDDTSKSMWNNCSNGFNCATATDPEGRYSCDATRKVGVPAGWTKPSSWYDADDGCDCGGGEVDPDCSDASATLYGCSTGQVCSTSGTCVAAAAVSRPTVTISTLHFGGMCSRKFEETSSSKLNSTVYKVRLASAPGTRVDATINMNTVSTISSTYAEVKSYLDQYCVAPSTCHIYAYSAGASSVGYAMAMNPTKYTGIASLRYAAGADGGSDLANWGSLAKLVACPLAPSLTKSGQRNLFDHNVPGNMGKTVYRSGAKGHDWWAPWGWSAYYLWAATSQISGEDDGAVGLDSAGGCTSSAGRSDLNCAKFTGNVCATSGCPVPKLDHYEMKIKPMIEAGW